MSIAIEAIRSWREDPVKFVSDCFGVTCDEWQKDALIAYSKHNRIAMKASKGVGKSAVMSWIIWHFLTCFDNPKIAVTSISEQNLKQGLWVELAFWMNKSELHKHLFEFTKTRIYLKTSPETWSAVARSWAQGADQSQQANALAGLHAENILFCLDEVSDIPDGVMAAAEAALSGGGNSKLVMAGNPTRLSGPLYRACTRERNLWSLITINSDPKNPKRSSRVSIQWAQEQIDKYGADSPYVLVNVMGEFPPSSMNSLLGPEQVEEAMQRKHHESIYMFSQKRIGVDVALQGDDDTCICARQGLQAFKMVIMKNANPSEISARVIAAKIKFCSEMEYVDNSGGWGSGVVDNLKQAGHSPIGVQFAGRADDERFYNKRSEMWFRMADWVKNGGSLPNDPDLAKELTTPTYFLRNGRFLLEPKELIKKRLGFSTDRSDALACTFFHPEMPAQTELEKVRNKYGNNRVLSEFDPFKDA